MSVSFMYTCTHASIHTHTHTHIVLQLEGVKYMNSNKVIHRDLKLGNLFLGRHDDIKIGDFGLAVSPLESVCVCVCVCVCV